MTVVGAAILLAIGLVLMWVAVGIVHIIGLVLAIIAGIVLAFLLIQMLLGGTFATFGRRRGPPPAA